MCYKELYRIHIPDKKAPLSAWVSVYVSIYRISKRINTLYNQKRRHFSAPFPGRCYPPSEPPTSGIPAIEVNILITPAITDADRTYFQSTCPRAAAVPIPAIAAWATVFTARIPAAFSHFRLSTDTLNTQFFSTALPPFFPEFFPARADFLSGKKTSCHFSLPGCPPCYNNMQKLNICDPMDQLYTGFMSLRAIE